MGKKATEDNRDFFRQLLLLALQGNQETLHEKCSPPLPNNGELLESAEKLADSLKVSADFTPAVAEGVGKCKQHNIPLDTCNTAGETPLFFAAARCFACYYHLVWNEVSPVTKNTWGVTALNQACQLLIDTGDPRVLQHLIENKYYDIDALDDSDQTILHQAAKANSPIAIKYIVKLGANINHRDSSGKTALYIAALRCSYDSFDMLISLGAKSTGNYIVDQDANTMLHAAACHPMASRKLIKRLIFMGIPLKGSCCCSLTKKKFCKSLNPHITQYMVDKNKEYQERLKANKSSPSIRRFFSMSSSSSVSRAGRSGSSADLTKSGKKKE